MRKPNETKYLVVYERTGENYSAHVPDLPGCIACSDTLEETERLMKTAIELHIEALKKEDPGGSR